MSEYILGVAAECEFEVSKNRPIQLPDNLANLDAAPLRPTVRGRESSARALEHYRKLLDDPARVVLGQLSCSGCLLRSGRVRGICATSGTLLGYSTR